ERRIRADEDVRPALAGLDHRAGDLALARPVDAPPRADRAAAPEVLGDQIKHPLHLGRLARHGEDVLDDEPWSSAERIDERTRTLRQLRPACRVLRVTREARTQIGRKLRNLDLRHAERMRNRLAGHIVGCAAEAAGYEQEVDARRLAAHVLGDLLD